MRSRALVTCAAGGSAEACVAGDADGSPAVTPLVDGSVVGEAPRDLGWRRSVEPFAPSRVCFTQGGVDPNKQTSR